MKTNLTPSEIALKAVATRRANAAARLSAPTAAPVVKEGMPESGMVPLYSCSLVRDGNASADNGIMTDASSAAKVLRAVIGNKDREHFAVAALDARRKVIGVQIVSVGTLTATLIHPREVFKPAILLNAAAIVLSHNHPSGDPSPSAEDRESTRRIQRAGELLGIPVADHVIIGGGESFFSFRESGML